MSMSSMELSLAERDVDIAVSPSAAAATDDVDLTRHSSSSSSSCKLVAVTSPSCRLLWNLGSSAGNPVSTYVHICRDNDLTSLIEIYEQVT